MFYGCKGADRTSRNFRLTDVLPELIRQMFWQETEICPESETGDRRHKAGLHIINTDLTRGGLLTFAYFG